MTLKAILTCILLGCAAWCFGQDAIFSQFHKSNIYLNPATTGIDGGLSFTAVNREQWGSVNNLAPIPGTFSSQFISIEYSNAALKSGFSLFFMHDREGDANLKTEYGGFNYCYVLPWEQVNRLHNFRIGFGIHYSKKSLDWDKLLFSDQLHPKGEDYFLANSNHAQFYDEFSDQPPWWTGVNAGLLYRYSEDRSFGKGKEISIGLSATHALNLFSPSSFESLQKIGTALDKLAVLHASAYFPDLAIGTKGNRFTPIFNGRLQHQGGISAFTLGADLLYNSIGIGLYYHNTWANTINRSTDAFITSLNFEVPIGKDLQTIEIGMSYDFNLNGLASYSGGVFELVLKYRIAQKEGLAGNKCPPVSRLHRLEWENKWYNQKRKRAKQ